MELRLRRQHDEDSERRDERETNDFRWKPLQSLSSKK